jgi:hypothetical protein
LQTINPPTQIKATELHHAAGDLFPVSSGLFLPGWSSGVPQRVRTS